MGFRRTRGNDANVLTSPSVDDDKQSAHRSNAKRDESLLIRIGFVIRHRDRVRVVENRNRLGHADAVLAEVDSGLARLIPLEAHSSSVRTDCAYVNPDGAGGEIGGMRGDCGDVRFLRPNRVQNGNRVQTASKQETPKPFQINEHCP